MKTASVVLSALAAMLVLALIALDAEGAAFATYVDSSGATVTLHDDACMQRAETAAYFASVPGSTDARYATHSVAATGLTHGCWIVKRGMVLLLYIDDERQSVLQERFSKVL